MIHDLGEYSLADIHPSLSAKQLASVTVVWGPFRQKKFKSKNLQTRPKRHVIKRLHGTCDSRSGQQ